MATVRILHFVPFLVRGTNAVPVVRISFLSSLGVRGQHVGCCNSSNSSLPEGLTSG